MPIIIFLLFLFTGLTHNILAVEDSITPTITPKSSNLEDIQKIREVVQQKVKEKLKQISTPSNIPKSIIGTITQIDPTQITINYKNDTKTILISEETVFIDDKRNKTKLEKIKVGQEILAMGLSEESGSINAKRIVIITLKTIENNNHAVVGKIVDISQTSPIFILIPSKNKDQQYQIKTDTKTEIVDKNNKKIDIKNLKSGQKIICVIKPDEKMSKTFYAVKIINLDYQPTASASPTITP